MTLLSYPLFFALIKEDEIKPNNHGDFGLLIFGLFAADDETMLIPMKFTIPLGGLPPRCARCLFACVRCTAVAGDLECAKRMTKIAEDIVRDKLEWFPNWRRHAILESEDD